MRKLLSAVQAQVLVSAEQGLVAERRHVVAGEQVLVRVVAGGGKNGIDVYQALPAADGVNAAVDGEQSAPQRITDLAKTDKAHSILVPDPLEWHSRHVGA